MTGWAYRWDYFESNFRGNSFHFSKLLSNHQQSTECSSRFNKDVIIHTIPYSTHMTCPWILTSFRQTDENLTYSGQVTLTAYLSFSTVL